MKGKGEIKVCSNSPKEKENLGKVIPGSDFKEQKLIIPFATVFS